jgi:hypothetical protein
MLDMSQDNADERYLDRGTNPLTDRRGFLSMIGAVLLLTASTRQTVADDDQEGSEQEPDPRRESGDEEMWSLTVNLVHAETGDPVCAYFNPYSWGNDGYLGEQGPMSAATWDDLSDGEYEIWVYDETNDWSDRESVWINGSDSEIVLTVTR